MDLKGICYKMNIIEKENKELEELKQSKKVLLQQMFI